MYLICNSPFLTGSCGPCTSDADAADAAAVANADAADADATDGTADGATDDAFLAPEENMATQKHISVGFQLHTIFFMI